MKICKRCFSEFKSKNGLCDDCLEEDELSSKKKKSEKKKEKGEEFFPDHLEGKTWDYVKSPYKKYVVDK